MGNFESNEADLAIQLIITSHDHMAALTSVAGGAVARGDFAGAVGTCITIAQLFDTHGAVMEDGLLGELRGDPRAVAGLARIDAEHRRLEVDLAVLAAGDLREVGRVLSELIDHTASEETVLVPLGLRLLPERHVGADQEAIRTT